MKPHARRGTDPAPGPTGVGSSGIWVCDADGGQPRQLTFLGRAITARGVWSPDGKWIAFTSFDRDNYDVYVVSAEGGPARAVTTGRSDDGDPSWSRDGRWIYFNSDRSGRYELWKIRVDGGEAIQITRNGGCCATESEDATFLYYGKATIRGGPAGVWRMPVGGGEETRVLTEPGWGTWALVGHHIVFLDASKDETPRFFDFDTVTGNTRLVATPSPRAVASSSISVSADRRSLLYAVDATDGADIMMVDDYR